MGLLSSAQPVYRDIGQASHATRDPQALTSLACDLSFVSDDSTPPESMVARQVERLNNPKFVALWWDIFARLRSDEVIPHRARVMGHVKAAIRDASINVDANWLDAIGGFFDQVNQVMFQHQTLGWLAESQFKLHLYGSGWETHPTLGRCARGEIDSDATRLAIHRASRINIAANVYGAVTARMIEGVGVGGFYLLRFTPADLLERFFSPMWEFCAQNEVETNAQLEAQATPAVRLLLDFASRTIGIDVLRAWPDFVTELRGAAEAGYTRSAAAILPQYPAVSFSSRDEMLGLVERYLYDVPERQRLAEEMRRHLVARFNHVSVGQRIHATPAEVAA